MVGYSSQKQLDRYNLSRSAFANCVSKELGLKYIAYLVTISKDESLSFGVNLRFKRINGNVFGQGV